MLAVDDDRIAHLQEFLQVGIISLLHGKWALTLKTYLVLSEPHFESNEEAESLDHFLDIE